jgi:DeoR/GlpR family transcriptional regulator of sugar metabolism
MIMYERQHKILKILEKRPSARVVDLSDSLGVSPATIRRDLDRLHKDGQIKRIHGGAALLARSVPEPPVLQRSSLNLEEKKRIGKAAAGLINEGETVFIGSGSTTIEVARNLIGRKNLTVITNALTVATLLSQEEGISLIVTGGFVRSSELSFVGHLTEQALSELRSQKVIMGIKSINLDQGLTNDYLPEVSTDRVIIQSAQEVILVADHTKFGTVSTALVAPLGAIHTLVTDTGIDPQTLSEVREQVRNIILA